MKMNREDRDRLALLEHAVVSMEIPSREVFLMHRLEELSYPEIAERLGLPVAEVERHFAAAMSHLMRVMDKGEGGGAG